MTQMSIAVPIPTSNNIVVIQDPIETVTANGIILPDAFTLETGNKVQRFDRVDRSLRSGTVVAVGPGRMYADYTRARMDLLVGDKILFGRLSGIGIEYGNESYVVMNQKEVIAITEEGNDEG